MSTSDGGGSTFRDFPRVDPSQVVGVKASALNADHKLVMKDNDGALYAVPLFDLKSDPITRMVTFRCQWGGGGTRSAMPNDRIEIVRE